MPKDNRSKTEIVTTPPPLTPISRSKAVSCLCLNLLATPGWGSFVAGRRVTGFMQVLLAVIGITLTLIWFIGYVIQVAREMEIPPISEARLWIGLAGAFLFAVAWFWALATSLQILRAARKTNA